MSNTQTDIDGSTEKVLKTNLQNLTVPKSFFEALSNRPLSDVKVSDDIVGNPSMRLLGVELYTTSDPLSEAIEQVSSIACEDDPDLVLLFGLGLGLHAEALRKRFKAPLVIFEPNLDVIAATLGQKQLSLGDASVLDNLSDVGVVVQNKLRFSKRNIVTTAIGAYQSLFPDQLKALSRTVNRAIVNAAVLDNTADKQAGEWTRYSLTNTPRVVTLPTLESLGGIFEGKPGIVVGAGPSLDKNINELKKAKGRAVIIAVSTALKALDRAGIVPDMVIVIESTDLTRHFEGIKWLDEVTLVLSLHCYPQFYDLKTAHTVSMLDSSVVSSDMLTETLGRRKVQSGGSVTCSGFSTLYELGCNPITLIGTDLAFTNDCLYAAGSVDAMDIQFDPQKGTANLGDESVKGHVKDRIVEQVPAYGGQSMVFTQPAFSLFRDWFEGAAQSWAAHRTLINSTQGGARIEGFEELTLLQTIERWCVDSLEISDQIDKACRGSNPPSNDGLIQLMQQELNALSQVVEISGRADKAAQKALTHLKKRSIPQAQTFIKKLEKAEQDLGRTCKQSPVLDHMVSARAHQIRLGVSQDKSADPVRQTSMSLKRSRKLFTAISGGAKTLVGGFRQALKQLEENS